MMCVKLQNTGRCILKTWRCRKLKQCEEHVQNSLRGACIWWWGETFPTATKVIRETSPALTLMVDASQLACRGGGGAVWGQREPRGWSMHESSCHINVLELHAVYF